MKILSYNDPAPSYIQLCSGCERELDLEGLHELAQNGGYTGCCNKSTLTR